MLRVSSRIYGEACGLEREILTSNSFQGRALAPPYRKMNDTQVMVFEARRDG